MTITLEQKFETLETQLGTQHTEIMNALDTIATALGAPPPGPTTTLADVVTALTQTNTILNGIREDNSTFYAAMLDVAGLINTNTDIIITNNSLNAQRLLQAIYSTACQCPTPTALISPPIDVTPTSLADEEKCRRIQFYLSVFGNWLTKIANYGSAAGFVTGDTLGTLLGLAASEAGIVATGAEVGAAAGPPGIVIGAIVGLIIGAIATFGGSVLIDYANQFNTTEMKSALLAAMFAATNADEGYTAFKTTILANMDAIPAQIIYTLWWSAWSNDIYLGVPTVDDSAFDGTICAGESGSCTDVTSSAVTLSGGAVGQGIAWAIPGATLSDGIVTSSGAVTASVAIFVEGDYAGWTVRALVNGIRILYRSGGLSSSDLFTTISVDEGHFATMPTTGSLWMDNGFTSTTPFQIRICPPGVDNPV